LLHLLSRFQVEKCTREKLGNGTINTINQRSHSVAYTIK
jgi:hypothetical protein